MDSSRQEPKESEIEHAEIDTPDQPNEMEHNDTPETPGNVVPTDIPYQERERATVELHGSYGANLQQNRAAIYRANVVAPELTTSLYKTSLGKALSEVLIESDELRQLDEMRFTLKNRPSNHSRTTTKYAKLSKFIQMKVYERYYQAEKNIQALATHDHRPTLSTEVHIRNVARKLLRHEWKDSTL